MVGYRLRCAQCRNIYHASEGKKGRPIVGAIVGGVIAGPIGAAIGAGAGANAAQLPSAVCPKCGSLNSADKGAFASRVVPLGLHAQSAAWAQEHADARGLWRYTEPEEEALFTPAIIKSSFPLEPFIITDRRVFVWPATERKEAPRSVGHSEFSIRRRSSILRMPGDIPAVMTFQDKTEKISIEKHTWSVLVQTCRALGISMDE